jgi:hypothetical protein
MLTSDVNIHLLLSFYLLAYSVIEQVEVASQPFSGFPSHSKKFGKQSHLNSHSPTKFLEESQVKSIYFNRKNSSGVIPKFFKIDFNVFLLRGLEP